MIRFILGRIAYLVPTLIGITIVAAFSASNVLADRRARLARTYGRSGQPCGVALPYVVWGFDT